MENNTVRIANFPVSGKQLHGIILKKLTIFVKNITFRVERRLTFGTMWKCGWLKSVELLCRILAVNVLNGGAR